MKKLNKRGRRGKHKIVGNTRKICGDLRKGEGWGRVHGLNKIVLQGLSGRKTGNLEVGLGWTNGGRKDQDFGGGKI